MHQSDKTNSADRLSRISGVEKPSSVEEILESLCDQFRSEAMITVQKLLAVDRLFEEKYRENILYSIRTKVLICKELQSVDIRFTSSLLDDPVYKSIIHIEYIFYTNRTQSIDNRDNTIDYIDYSQTNSDRNRTGNNIDTESTRISHKSDISQSTEINSVSTDFYRMIAVEDPDQRNNIIIYKKLNRAQFVSSRIVLAATAVKDILYKETSEKLEDLVVGLQLEDTIIRKQKTILSKDKYKEKYGNINPKRLFYYTDRLYIPIAGNLRSRLIQIYYNNSLADYFGRAHIIELLQRKYYWKEFQNKVQDYIALYTIYQEVKTPQYRSYRQLQSLSIPQKSFAELTIDFIIELFKIDYQEKTVDAILVIVNRLIKYSGFIPISTIINTAKLTELFYNQIELEYRNPDRIISDRESVFTNKFWSELYYYSKIKLRYSTTFYPQTDRQTEQINQILKDYLYYFIDKQYINWAQLLKTI